MRIIGIQAMEQTSYRAAQRAGDCHAVDATNRLEQLVKRSKRRIRVASLYPESRSRGRRLRSIAVRYKGRWRDVGRILISEGHALWWPGRNEDATNVRYSVLTQRAAAAQQGPVSPNDCGDRARTRASRSSCGPTGTPTAPTPTTSTASGSRSATSTRSTRCRSPAGTCATPGLRRFTFPPGASIPPGPSMTVYAGQGEDFGSEFFWNLTAPVFENITRDDRGIGDGAYLFDPQGDIRASMIYPCRVNCADPAAGPGLDRRQPAAQRGRCRSATTRASPIDARGLPAQERALQLRVPARLRAQARRDDARLHPGRSRRRHRSSSKHWGMTGQILNNGGDSASARQLHRRDARLHRVGLEVLLSARRRVRAVADPRRVLLVGGGDLAGEVCEALEAGGGEVTWLEDADDGIAARGARGRAPGHRLRRHARRRVPAADRAARPPPRRGRAAARHDLRPRDRRADRGRRSRTAR